MPFQLINTFYNPQKIGLQPLKNSLPYKSIGMGFNPCKKVLAYN
jgi:hypothetical protein